jgi:hypothetical protein
VSDVIGSVGLNWQWIHEDLADLATFGHVIGDHTLHATVRRVGSAKLVTWDGLAPSSRRQSEVLLEAVRAEAGTDDLISLPAGFDSRMILAAFLAPGMRPNLPGNGCGSIDGCDDCNRDCQKFNLLLEHLHPKWMEAVRRMPRHLKLRNRWHWLAIRNLCPELFSFPITRAANP